MERFQLLKYVFIYDKTRTSLQRYNDATAQLCKQSNLFSFN